MSGIAAVVYDDCIEVLTDGASYARDGTYVATVDKASAGKGADFLAVGRGPTDLVRDFCRLVVDVRSYCNSFDETLDALNNAALPAVAAKWGVIPERFATQVMVAGFSEVGGPGIWLMGTCVWGKDNPPFTFLNAGMSIVSPMMGCPDLSGESLAPGLLRRVGVKVFNGIRAHPNTHVWEKEGPGLYVVGGHLDLSTVRRDGVTTERLHTWDDKPGEPINPFADAGNVTPIIHASRPSASLTRRERRAEKKLRRAS